MQSPSKVDMHTTRVNGTVDGAPPLLPFRYESCADWNVAPRTGEQQQHSSGCRHIGSWAQYQALSNISLEDSETSRSTTSAAVSVSGRERARDQVYEDSLDWSTGRDTSRKSAYAIAESVTSDPRDTHGTGFRLRSQNAQRNRALTRAGQFWDKRAARLAPMVAKYSLYGRRSGWLAVVVSPPIRRKTPERGT